MRLFRLLSILSLAAVAAFHAPSTAQAGDSLPRISKQLVRGIQKEKNVRVALLAFPYANDLLSSGSTIVSERLTTLMVGAKGVRVVERNLLRKILEEQHLSETGVVDAASAKQIGQILGVDVIVTGTLQDLDNNQTMVNARALHVETGEVMAASQGRIERSWNDTPRSARPRYQEARQEDGEPARVSNEAIMIGYPVGGGAKSGFRR